MYSIDYPFESMTEAAEWLDASKLDAHVRAKIEHENAQALLKLNHPATCSSAAGASSPGSWSSRWPRCSAGSLPTRRG